MGSVVVVVDGWLGYSQQLKVFPVKLATLSATVVELCK